MIIVLLWCINAGRVSDHFTHFGNEGQGVIWSLFSSMQPLQQGTGLVSYPEDNGFFWLQRNPWRVQELGESLESQLVECVGGVKGSALSWRDGSGAQARSVLLCCGCEGERGKPVATLVDWENTDWVSKYFVWPASWSGADDSPLSTRWIFNL